MRVLALLVVVGGASCRPPPGSSPDAGPPVAMRLEVVGDQTLTTPFEWGILHGVTRSELNGADPTALIRALRPRSWRVSNHNNAVWDWVVTDAQLPATVGTKIVWTLQDSFMHSFNLGSSARLCIGPTMCPTADAKRFASFADLRTAWQAFLSQFLAAQPAYDWYDVFSEPDLQVFGLTVTELATLYLDAEQAVRARHPGAKIVAPSYANFSGDGDDRLVVFARAVVAAGGTPDALSWHEFGPRPLAVVEHSASVRAALCDAGPCPEFHVNEYEGADFTLSPGRAVAWLAAFQDARVTYANRACWDVTGTNGRTISTCWTTFGGLLDESYRATQSLYWVHERFAQLSGARWIPVTPFERIDVANRRLDGVAVVAGDLGAASKTVRLLVGNFGIGDAGPVELVITRFPHAMSGQVTVTTERFATLGPQTLSKTAQTPEALPSSEVAVSAGAFTVTIPLIRAGEAFGVVLTAN